MHKRTQIKNAVVSALTGLVTTGTNVFPSRVHAIPAKHLPGLLVYPDEEDSEPGETGPNRSLDRELSLVIDGQAKSGADIDDVLDGIAEEIETAMNVDRHFSGLALESFLSSTVFRLSGEGRQRAGKIKMTYKIFYQA